MQLAAVALSWDAPHARAVGLDDEIQRWVGQDLLLEGRGILRSQRTIQKRSTRRSSATLGGRLSSSKERPCSHGRTSPWASLGDLVNMGAFFQDDRRDRR